MNTGGQATTGHKICQSAAKVVYHGSPPRQIQALGDAGGTEDPDAILGDLAGGKFLRFI